MFVFVKILCLKLAIWIVKMKYCNLNLVFIQPMSLYSRYNYS
jgi:hypothetical protein